MERRQPGGKCLINYLDYLEPPTILTRTLLFVYLVAATPNIIYHTPMDEKELTTTLQQIINQHLQTSSADPHTMLQTALTAYHNARTDGLCHEGAWEIALQTLSNQTNKTNNALIPG